MNHGESVIYTVRPCYTTALLVESMYRAKQLPSLIISKNKFSWLFLCGWMRYFFISFEAVSGGEIRHSTNDGRQYSSAVQSSAQKYPADSLMA